MEMMVKFLSSSIFMLPLMVCSLVTVTLIIERGIVLRRRLVLPPDLFHAIFEFRVGDDPERLVQAVGDGRSPLGRLTRTCLEHLPWTKAENVEALQTQARLEINRLERGLVVLEILTGVAPMLGLLGTVGGLITIFSGGDQGTFVGNVPLLARGISEALFTTVFGLTVAIPALIGYTYYTRKIENMAIEMEGLCADLLAKLYLQPTEPEAEPPSSSRTR